MATTGKGLPRSLKSATLDIPVATTTAIGGVKKASNVAAPAAVTAAAATQSAAAPTKAEFDAFVAEYNKLRTDLTALRATVAGILTANKNAGQM